VPTLRELLSDGKAHVFDGAMGTLLHHQGAPPNACFDELALRRPELVASAHAAYVAAGAELIETNSFGANPIKLAGYGLAEDTEALNEAAARVAREAAGDRIAVIGAVGPLGARVEPFGELGLDEAAAAFARQVTGLLRGGVDGFILETFSDVNELAAAIRAVRAHSDLAIVAQMTIGSDGCTAYGTAPESFGPALVSAGADVVGINCSTGPSVVLDGIERLARVIDVPLSAQPNAGLPRDLGDRKLYVASPEYVGDYARRMVHAGARFVGGCCGTTPEHIAAIKRYVRAAAAHCAADSTVSMTSPHPPPDGRPLHPDGHPAAAHRAADSTISPTSHNPPPDGRRLETLAQRSRLGGRLAHGEFVRTVELVPPRGADAAPLLAQARALHAAGIDAINIPDGPRAQSRMSALLSGLLVEREVGIETIPHYACRDRNLLGMLSDLLGAAAAGLRNLLVVTGDPPKMGPYPEATAVFDIDAIGLTNLLAQLNRGLDPGGNTMGAPTAFVHGVGVNPAAPDLEREFARYAWKVDAGACFAMTQPVFDLDQLDHRLDRLQSFGIPVIIGVWPLVSLRNAEFLANEVPGVIIPVPILERMRRASADGREAALAEGVLIARETVERFRHRVAGVQVAAPLGRVEVALEVVCA
jgi:homocysteine S-methyltransferase